MTWVIEFDDLGDRWRYTLTIGGRVVEVSPIFRHWPLCRAAAQCRLALELSRLDQTYAVPA